MTTIACCTRDALLGAQIGDMLQAQGLRHELFPNESALMRMLRHRGGMGLVLIDLGREMATEESVLSWLACRAAAEAVPVMLLSSHWSGHRIASALDAGADDCVAKPVDRVELMARIKAVLRRSRAAQPGVTRITLGDFELDQGDGTLTDRGVQIDLTPREFALAWLFFANRGVRLAREAISLAIWGSDKDIAGRTIEQHVYKLRKKIGLSPARGVVIHTTYGQGYRLDLCSERQPSHVFAPAGLAAAAANRLSLLDAERNGAHA
jgi:DNA-binding response OmpR family regulator